jgi:hypothetical protein
MDLMRHLTGSIKEPHTMTLNGLNVYSPETLIECGLNGLTIDEIRELKVDHLTRYQLYLGRIENHTHFDTIFNGRISELARKTSYQFVLTTEILMN